MIPQQTKKYKVAGDKVGYIWGVYAYNRFGVRYKLQICKHLKYYQPSFFLPNNIGINRTTYSIFYLLAFFFLDHFFSFLFFFFFN